MDLYVPTEQPKEQLMENIVLQSTMQLDISLLYDAQPTENIETTDDDDEEEDDDDNIFDELTDTELDDLHADIFALIDELFASNILKMSSPSFYTEIQDAVVDTIYTEWYDCDVCYNNQAEYDELTALVGELVTVYLEYDLFPKRSVYLFHYKNYTDFSTKINNKKQQKQQKEKTTNNQKNCLEEKIAHLQNLVQPTQRTKEWYDFRHNMISASNLWKVFGTENQVNSLILEKCKPNDGNTNNAFSGIQSIQWGVKYEPITVALYETLFNTKLGDFGCIQHPTYAFIGASPDGINIDVLNRARYGRMVEIKNIFNREITGIPKLDYWVQMQIQMETCNLDECDFVETRIKEYQDEISFYEDTINEYKGVVLSLQQASNETIVYRYLPLNFVKNARATVDGLHKAITKWIEDTVREAKRENLKMYSIAYWHLDELSCVLVERNREWFRQAVPHIENTWKTIVLERETGYDHRISINTKTTNTNKIVAVSCSTLNTNETHLIENLPNKNILNLVKLE